MSDPSSETPKPQADRIGEPRAEASRGAGGPSPRILAKPPAARHAEKIEVDEDEPRRRGWLWGVLGVLLIGGIAAANYVPMPEPVRWVLAYPMALVSGEATVTSDPRRAVLSDAPAKPKAEPARTESAKPAPPKSEPAKVVPPKPDRAAAEPAKSDPAKNEPPKSEPAKSAAALQTEAPASPAPKLDAPSAEDILRRRLAEAEERLANATSQTLAGQRTIETLQARVAEQDRELAQLRPRVEALNKQVGDIQQQAAEALSKAQAQQAQQPAQAQRAPPLPPPRGPEGRAIRPQGQAPVAAAPPAPQPADAPAGRAGATPASCADLASRFNRTVTLEFGRNQIRLSPTHERRLAEMVNAVAPCAQYGLVINGFADSRGPAQRNSTLAFDRASAAARYLQNRGVARNRLSVTSYAASNPIAPNDTDEGRARNRRVEMVVRRLQ